MGTSYTGTKRAQNNPEDRRAGTAWREGRRGDINVPLGEEDERSSKRGTRKERVGGALSGSYRTRAVICGTVRREMGQNQEQEMKRPKWEHKTSKQKLMLGQRGGDLEVWMVWGIGGRRGPSGRST